MTLIGFSVLHDELFFLVLFLILCKAKHFFQVIFPIKSLLYLCRYRNIEVTTVPPPKGIYRPGYPQEA